MHLHIIVTDTLKLKSNEGMVGDDLGMNNIGREVWEGTIGKFLSIIGSSL